MAGFGIFWNGAVAQFKVLRIFVLAWCWVFATFLSRETLATILRNSTLKKQKMNDEKIKNIKSQKNAALLLIFGPLILLISYIGKTDFDKYGINNYVICLSLFVLIICGGISLKNSLRKQKELNRWLNKFKWKKLNESYDTKMKNCC